MQNMNDVAYSNEPMTVDSKQLQVLLGCGRRSAENIGTAAGARIRIGGRVLWNVEKIRMYLAAISE